MKKAEWLSVAGTVASAGMCVLTAHPFELWVLAPFCLAPLALALSRASIWFGFSLGLLHGFVVNVLGFGWTLAPLRDVAGFSGAGALALFSLVCLLHAGRTALTGFLCATCARRGWPIIASFPFAVVAVEVVYPMVLPWHTGVFALGSTPWAQLAELGGPLALTLFVSVTAAATASASQGWRTRATLRPLATCAGVLVLVTGFGYFRVSALDREIAAAPVTRIGVIQGNLGAAHLETRDSVAIYAAESRRLLESDAGVDLVVWPESVASLPVRESALPAFVSDEVLVALGPHSNRSRVPILFGIVIQGDGKDSARADHGDYRLWNAAVLADPTGTILGRYDKRSLVPLGEESVGPAFLGLRAVTRFTPGSARPPMTVSGHRIGVTICYEDVLHRSFRDGVLEQDPDLLVNLTSDVWFRGSAGPGLHLALSSLRAIEHRRFLLRVTTTGVTSLVDPAGRIVWSLPQSKLASGVARVRWLRGTTPYRELGDWPWIAAAVTGLIALARGRRPPPNRRVTKRA